MAPSSDADDPNDVALSNPPTEDTTATKKQSLNCSTGILTSPSSSYSIVTLTLQPPLLPTLPFELIAEILSKLPVKSLMQFQCVCKSWKSLISDPKFAKKHLRMSTKHHHLISTFANSALDYPLTSLFTDVTATAMQLEYPLTKQYRHCFDPIVSSCHGILCIAIDYVSVVLWNPSISKFTRLPSLDKSLYCYGFSFGYDHSSDTYKVVACGIVINGNVKKPVKVHTLGTNSWRTIQDFPSGFICEDSSGKFVCGTITWLGEKISTSSWHIISLDLEKESYLEIVQPDYGGVTLTSLRIGVLRDCLCIFSRSRSDTFTGIWLMKEYGNKESWIKLFRVPDIRDLGYYPSVCALYVSEDDQVLLEIDSQDSDYSQDDSELLDIQSKLVVYNSRDGTFEDLNIQNTNGVTGTQVYHESLISPCF
ncbi:hypothetical protein TSUD_381760 [Trifolium subterraneum]|uniref:F-box domain-containing protein n=1 Tax=Trifolium subterraneum TaxID=3900 RepID=A0A2Z6LQ18_TRISU|nr:hypothetical protein TSUD_381760 [Trifolium subterraneum]